MKKIILLFILLLPIVYADEISLSLNQKEYYFTVGEDALLEITSDNSHDSDTNGMLSYTITQSYNQGGFSYSSSNTQSTNFLIEKGKSVVPLNFGTSDGPLSLDIDLNFQYNDGTQKVVSLNNIKVHFVESENQKNNQQSMVSSSSQEVSQKQQPQDPFAQQNQRMQQMIDQMFGQNQAQQQSQQQRLQNNQLSQDSSALKQQMHKQIQERQELEKQFQQSMAQNQEFQEAHSELMNQGYNLTGGSLNPTDTESGEFNLEYQKNGQSATLKGSLQSGSMQSLVKDSPEIRQEMLDSLQNSEEFKRLDQELQSQGFMQSGTEYSIEINESTLSVDYINKQNQTAVIKGTFNNGTITSVELQEEDVDRDRSRLLTAFVLAVILCGAYFFHKHFKKSKASESEVITKKPKPFNYRVKAQKLLAEAEKLYDKGKHKEAYSMASQSIRLYLSYAHGLSKEITSDELIDHLKKNKHPYKEIQSHLDVCCYVEFAKQAKNDREFAKIISFGKKLIKIK